MKNIALALLLFPLIAPLAGARRSSGSRSRAMILRSTRAPKVRTPSTGRSAARCATCTRDAKGRIVRSRTATRDFQRTHPCPFTRRATRACKGYVIDHIVPLKCGGADAPTNMQWQVRAAAKSRPQAYRDFHPLSEARFLVDKRLTGAIIRGRMSPLAFLSASSIPGAKTDRNGERKGLRSRSGPTTSPAAR